MRNASPISDSPFTTSLVWAAKMVGQDVSIFERSMRGLTMAVEDNSAKGMKAREWLERFGVDIRGLKDGTAGTAETFERIAAGLGSIDRKSTRLNSSHL